MRMCIVDYATVSWHRIRPGTPTIQIIVVIISPKYNTRNPPRNRLTLSRSPCAGDRYTSTPARPGKQYSRNMFLLANKQGAHNIARPI